MKQAFQKNLKRLARVGIHNSGLACGEWGFSENNGEPPRGIYTEALDQSCVM